MSSSYKVSVVVATYRRDAELVRALVSLADQSFTDFEIILVDDNDTPEWNRRVEAVVEEFKMKHPAVPLTYCQNHPNLGSAQARNVGIAAAQGAYITFLDDDDLYLPEKLVAQYAFMIERNLDFSITDLDLYYEDETLSEHRTRHYIKQTDNASLMKYHMMYHLTGTDTMMFAKSYIDGIGGFAPIDVGDEFYLMERAIKGGGHFGYLNRCDVKAYVHRGEGGLSSGQGKIDGENRLYDYKKKYRDTLDKKSVRYIRMRHHAVLAFAYLRMRRIGVFFKEAFLSFFSSPLACIKLFINR